MSRSKRPCPAGDHDDEDNDVSRVPLLHDDLLFML